MSPPSCCVPARQRDPLRSRGRRVHVSTIPGWLRPLVDAAAVVRHEQLSPFLPPDDAARESAVLILFGEGPDGPDVLLIERSHDLRSHAGQPAFPGGGIDPGDADVVAAALREAQEETDLDPAGVDVIATMPPLWIPISDQSVTPVVGWWRHPTPVRVVDPGEVASVHRVPLSDLVDPANRVQVQHPSGYIGPAFRVRGLLVWGFTGGLLARMLQLAGWERPWNTEHVVDLPSAAYGSRT
jgi:8-oxo-dGTP pyrophosphatase MutT (NUDIX family)